MTQYPTQLNIEGISFTAQRLSPINQKDRDIHISIYRDDIAYKADAYVGEYRSTVAVENPHDVMYFADCPAEESFKRYEYSKHPLTDAQWEALQAAFQAAIVVDPSEDHSPTVIPANYYQICGSRPNLEEQVLAARQEMIATGGAATYLDILGDDYDDL